MDEMNIKLHTRFMRNIVSKLISRAIYKKTGYKVNIQLNDLDVKFIDGETTINANVVAKLSGGEFVKLMKNYDLD